MEIRMLGPLEVLVDGEPVALGGARERALLVLLALSAGRTVSTDRLVDSLWGDDLPANPANALQALVSRLRRSIGAESVVTRTPGYALAVDPDAIDTVRFQDSVTEARQIRDPDQRAARLQAALSMWRGEALADFPFEEFSQQARNALEETRLLAIEERIKADLERGQAAELIPDIEELIASHPLRESLRASHMLALYRAGRQADALRAFTAARNTLGEELGIEPGPELRELEAAILMQDSSLVPQPEITTHRHEPQLPARIASFVGRSREIEEITQAIGTSRLITLTGSGGAGKTSLAIEVGRKLADRYRDGVWLVDLAPVTDAARVADTMLVALGLEQVAPFAGRSRAVEPIKVVVEFLRRRQALVIFDNCEHLIDAAAAAAEAVLLACAETDILTTSRERLGIAGEVLWRVPSLGIGDGDAPSEAVSLFIDRAAAVVSDFSPTAAEISSIIEICRRLDGMPLAIELAAARVRSLPIADIARRLETGIGILSRGKHHGADRQQTLEAAIDWSYRLLSAQERDLFARLSVFHGSFTLRAATAVATESSELLDDFERLLDSSMVSPAAAGGERRFRMLETIRMYAADKLAASGATDSVLGELMDYYLEEMAGVEDKLRAPDQLEHLERVEADIDTIRAMLDWGEHNDPPRALRLAGMLGWFWFLKGSSIEARERLDTLLAAAGDRASPRARGDALFYRSLHDPAPERVREDFALARDAYVQANHQEGIANATAMLASWGFDVEEWLVLIEEAADICTDAGYEWGLALIRFLQAGGAMISGDNATSVALSIEAADRFAVIGDHWGQGYSWYQAGTALRALGDYDRAVHAFESALEHARPMRLRREMAPVMSELASIATMRGEFTRAGDLLDEAQEYADDVPFAGSRGMVRNARGRLERLQGHLDTAIRLHRRAIELYPGDAGIGGRAYSYSCLGLAEEMAGDLGSAGRHHLQGLACARQTRDPYAVAFALEGLGATEIASGAFADGVQLISCGLSLRKSSGTPLPAGERFDVDRALDTARRSMSEEEFAAAWSTGENLDPDSVG